MITITLAQTRTGWTATFDGSTTMPNGIALPLPFTAEAPLAMVRADLAKRFPNALFPI